MDDVGGPGGRAEEEAASERSSIRGNRPCHGLGTGWSMEQGQGGAHGAAPAGRVEHGSQERQAEPITGGIIGAGQL